MSSRIKSCLSCRKPIGPDDDVYLIGFSRRKMKVCEECFDREYND